jgi:DNA-binding response OmpR family regulator
LNHQTRAVVGPAIFLLEEDDLPRRMMRSDLQSHGYHVRLAIDEEDAMERIDAGIGEIDLILVNLVNKTVEETLDTGRRLRDYAKLDRSTPLVVLPERFAAHLEGTNVCVANNDWITYYEDHCQIINLLLRLLPVQRSD